MSFAFFYRYKLRRRIAFFLLLAGAGVFIMNSCQVKHKGTLQSSIFKEEYCADDSSNSYALYVPEHYSECKSMPLVVILDPHGSGNFAIKKFKKSAGNYQCILAASNLVRNNYPEFITAVEALVRDVKSRFPVVSGVYIAGFSGGARMALAYAQNHKLNGVLVSGALATDEQLKTIHTQIYAIAGLADFNFPEIAPFVLNTVKTPSNLLIEIAGEMHEWPPENVLERALGMLFLNKDNAATFCFNHKNVLKEFSQKTREYADSCIKNVNLIETALVYKNILSVSDVPQRKTFEKSYESIIKSSDFNKELSDMRKSLQFEYRAREAYYKALTEKGTEWWNREIDELNIQIGNSDDKYMEYAYERIKAFLGIVCYSLTRNSLQADDLTVSSRILQVYKMVEPNNADMFYYTALYSLKTGRINDAANQLQQSVKAGFSDFSQMKKDFPLGILEKAGIN